MSLEAAIIVDLLHQINPKQQYNVIDIILYYGMISSGLSTGLMACRNVHISIHEAVYSILRSKTADRCFPHCLGSWSYCLLPTLFPIQLMLSRVSKSTLPVIIIQESAFTLHPFFYLKGKSISVHQTLYSSYTSKSNTSRHHIAN